MFVGMNIYKSEASHQARGSVTRSRAGLVFASGELGELLSTVTPTCINRPLARCGAGCSLRPPWPFPTRQTPAWSTQGNRLLLQVSHLSGSQERENSISFFIGIRHRKAMQSSDLQEAKPIWKPAAWIKINDFKKDFLIYIRLF